VRVKAGLLGGDAEEALGHRSPSLLLYSLKFVIGM
jgi:hypothetical protein